MSVEFEPTTQPWIVCAACRSTSGLVVTGARHFDGIMRETIDALCAATLGPGVDERDRLSFWRASWSAADQGFIDQFGRFYTREEAAQLATQNGQCEPTKYLFSEDLY